MTLTNYWWLLIWVFVGGAALSIAIPKRQELVLGKLEKRWGIMPALILILPYIVWAGFRSYSFGDTSAYQQAFRECAASIGEIGTYISGVTKDHLLHLHRNLQHSILHTKPYFYTLEYQSHINDYLIHLYTNLQIHIPI